MKRAALNKKNSKKWLDVQGQIYSYLEEILFRIEWHYGEGRAPFIFLPEYKTIKRRNQAVEYVCLIKLDLGGEGGTLRYSALDSGQLFDKIKKDIDEKYAIK